MLEYKTIYLTGGANTNVSPFLSDDGEMSYIQNFTTSKVGVLKKTGDYQIKNARISAAQNVLGGMDFPRADGTHEHFVAVNGASADIYKDVGGTWTAQSQSLTAGAKVRFAYSPPLDTLFSCNFSDATRSYDGSTWSTTTNVTDAPKAKFVYSFGQRIYLLNAKVGVNTYINRAYRSTTVETSPITWDPDEYIFFDDAITGVGRSGENMFIGCQNSCWILTLEDVKYQAIGRGVISHDSISDYGSWTIFCSDDGVYIFDGAKEIKISSAMQDFWDAIPNANKPYVQTKVRGHHIYVFIGDVTVGEVSIPNVVLNYNILQNNWTHLSLSENVNDTHIFTENTGKELFFGNDDGEIYQMFASNSQAGGVFGSYVETQWFYGSGPRNVDSFQEFAADGEKLSGLKVKYKVDHKGWVAVGELNGFSDFAKFKVSGKRIKFLLEETSKDNLFELYRLEIGFIPRFGDKKTTKEAQDEL